MDLKIQMHNHTGYVGPGFVGFINVTENDGIAKLVHSCQHPLHSFSVIWKLWLEHTRQHDLLVAWDFDQVGCSCSHDILWNHNDVGNLLKTLE